ncbi:YciI family protein [Inquilinus limosus]|uniref:YciI family protein n=1 Tax=Inquilinus limosus TaxID=171674 RepID=UPI0004178CE3|nr:YciI family protein [Inquilinus limosus]
MRYLLIVHVDPALIGPLSPKESRDLTRRCMVYDDELRRSGHLIACGPLAEPETGRIVRRRGDTTSVTDGPYAETKEHLGGFILIEARDMDEAVAIATTSPMAAMGSIEVREQPPMG